MNSVCHHSSKPILCTVLYNERLVVYQLNIQRFRHPFVIRNFELSIVNGAPFLVTYNYLLFVICLDNNGQICSTPF
jgi:hypothetical protein